MSANKIVVKKNLAFLKLRTGIWTMIDASDLQTALKCRWYASPNVMGGYYVCSHDFGSTQYLHRVLLGLTDRVQQVDHVNHNTRDNRRSNLRVVSNQQNAQNRKGAYTGSRIPIRGIAVDRRGGRLYLKARVMANYKYVAHEYFPYTKAGMRVAYGWLIEQRKRFLPNAQIPRDDLNAALALLPDEEAPFETRRGEKHGMAKLTASDIPVIRAEIAEGLSLNEIGRRHKVSPASIHHIKLGETWAHIPKEE